MRRLPLRLLLLLLFAPLVASAAPRQKIIFDCDLGGDIDDAFALALVLTAPEFEVLGLVMDHGDTEARARVACRFLYELGLEHIPVIVGRPTPHIVGKTTEPAPASRQYVWAEGFSAVQPVATNAADFIIESLRRHPNEVILFTVGPVPNLQDVIAKDPEALRLAKRIVAMFGSFSMGYNSSPIPSAEWNVVADVEAGKRFAASGAPITYAGLDVTTFVKLDEAKRLRLLQRQSPLTNALLGLYSLWLDEEYAAPDPTLFDAVAVGMVLWPELFTTRPAHVRVIDGGFTVIDESLPPNAEVGVTINTEEFLARIMQRYLRQNLGRAPMPVAASR